jgi:hypothetical protein
MNIRGWLSQNAKIRSTGRLTGCLFPDSEAPCSRFPIGLSTHQFHGVTGNGVTNHLSRLSYMSDNIILLNMEREQKTKRKIVCIKARGTGHDLDVHDFHIADNGINIS